MIEIKADSTKEIIEFIEKQGLTHSIFSFVHQIDGFLYYRDEDHYNQWWEVAILHRDGGMMPKSLTGLDIIDFLASDNYCMGVDENDNEIIGYYSPDDETNSLCIEFTCYEVIPKAEVQISWTNYED